MTNATLQIPILNEKQLKHFWENVLFTTLCWEWLGWETNSGYAQFRIGIKKYLVHRISYEMYKGIIPKYYEVDHLCKNKKCVNPDHLESVEGKENNRRSNSKSSINSKKTNCNNGHEFTIQNTYVTKQGHRECIICMKKLNKEYEKNNRESINKNSLKNYYKRKLKLELI